MRKYKGIYRLTEYIQFSGVLMCCLLMLPSSAAAALWMLVFCIFSVHFCILHWTIALAWYCFVRVVECFMKASMPPLKAKARWAALVGATIITSDDYYLSTICAHAPALARILLAIRDTDEHVKSPKGMHLSGGFSGCRGAC